MALIPLPEREAETEKRLASGRPVGVYVCDGHNSVIRREKATGRKLFLNYSDLLLSRCTRPRNGMM